MSLFVFFISLQIVAQHVSVNHVPITRSWRLLLHHAVVSSWWWAYGCPKHVEQLLEEKWSIQKVTSIWFFLSTLNIFISLFDQIDAQNLFHNTFCFMPLHVSNTYRCDDTRGCVMQFWHPDDEHMCSKHVEAWNKLTVKQILCIKLVK